MFRAPIATYRLQFNAQFTFADARKIVPYLAALGITDIYASPILRARKGSTHGYDTVDANLLNPELGTEEEFAELCAELARHGMGLVLDIVPNHMAVSHENPWWTSLLENGPQSRYVNYFDIDWRDDKVLLPILGRPYGEALDAKEIRLGFDAEGFFFSYYDKRLPLSPQSYPLILRECVEAVPAEGAGVELRDLAQDETVVTNSKFLKETLLRIYEQSDEFRSALDGAMWQINEDADRLDALLSAQWYRLAYWRIASETINYRRFFDVTDLVGVRVENPEVFEARNRRILDLIAEGKVTGLRADHIDGLHDPAGYLTRLQHRLGEPMYVVVEKILAPDETLPASWPVAGTTGYDFLDTVNRVFVDPDGLAQLPSSAFDDLVYERKKQVIDQLFSGEMRALGTVLGTLAATDRNARDFAPSELLAALVEITACMPVYRTYIRADEISDWDREILGRAIAEAQRRSSLEERVFKFVRRVLHLEVPSAAGFVMRWQQFTPRVMAKGVEDTAFYNYNRLVSLNEVGGEPGRISADPVAELHARNERIARDWPHTMNATSTHDTKRAEDVRARINVLSEIPDEWQRALKRWKCASNEQLLIYQTLIGAWPIDADRLTAYVEKAAREAKTHTSWLSPNLEYESSLKEFAARLLDDEPFMKSFLRFHRRIAFHGLLNSLAQVVLKIFSPGIPDFYQGTELWDFSLVDPDNRRPVDYPHRADALHRLPSYDWDDGSIKLFVTARSLAVRARHAAAPYRAIDTGTSNAVAFLRGDDLLVVVPRLTTQLVKPPKLPLGDVWRDHALAVSGRWRNVFTEEVVEGAPLPLRNLLGSFPVGVFERG
ncbi:MAG TPA: malto-oligosyltrehalose synthase [Thermoanaerobaculia bacterium]|nr:malto-oligosyltrehalose synthase [Thermoanaerobaculia bacterium]